MGVGGGGGGGGGRRRRGGGEREGGNSDEGIAYTAYTCTIDREIFAVINFRRYCITTKIKNMKYFQRRIIYDSFI